MPKMHCYLNFWEYSFTKSDAGVVISQCHCELRLFVEIQQEALLVLCVLIKDLGHVRFYMPWTPSGELKVRHSTLYRSFFLFVVHMHELEMSLGWNQQKGHLVMSSFVYFYNNPSSSLDPQKYNTLYGINTKHNSSDWGRTYCATDDPP